MELYFVTGNQDKFREASAIMLRYGIRLKMLNAELDELQEKEVSKVSVHKARQAFERFGKPLFVEDTGLYITGFNGYPGSLIKHFVNSIGGNGIAKCLRGKDRHARAVCVATYADRQGLRSFTGEIHGTIAGRPRGSYDFGWDPVFVPQGSKKTFAQMGMDEKNMLSHRRKALESLASWLHSR